MDKLNAAVKRLQTASEMSLYLYGKPLLLTYSGGKDSDACLEVAKIAGIPFEVQHSHTTADAPETVRHVRGKFRALELEGIHCEITYPTYKGQRTSMWDLIPHKLMPPTRLVRYCCEILKETAGRDRWIITGVRWAESASRKASRGIYEANGGRKAHVILNNDNDDLRRVTETCASKNKRTVNPIIDWTERMYGPCYETGACSATRCTASLVGLAASAAPWPVNPAESVNFSAGPGIGACIWPPLTGCWRSGTREASGLMAGRTPWTSTAGGWSTTFCRDRSIFGRRTMETMDQDKLVRRALLGDHEAAKRLTDAGVLVPCICGRTPKEHGPEDWKPTFYDPDSGGDPVSIECECGINFSIWSFDYYESRLAWNARAPILSESELKKLEEIL